MSPSFTLLRAAMLMITPLITRDAAVRRLRALMLIAAFTLRLRLPYYMPLRQEAARMLRVR